MKKIRSFVVWCLIATIIMAGCTPSATATPAESNTEAVVEEATEVSEAPAVEEESAPAASDEVVTINWWTIPDGNYSEETQRALAAEFEKTHPNIKVEVLVMPESGFDDKMTTALGAGEGVPDVAFFWNNNWLP